jgi:hypothetical protein
MNIPHSRGKIAKLLPWMEFQPMTAALHLHARGYYQSRCRKHCILRGPLGINNKFDFEASQGSQTSSRLLIYSSSAVTTKAASINLLMLINIKRPWKCRVIIPSAAVFTQLCLFSRLTVIVRGKAGKDSIALQVGVM